MNSLEELQQKRALLKVQIEQQRIDLKSTFLEVREEIEPSFLLKKAVRGLFKPAKNDTSGVVNLTEGFPGSFLFLVDIFVKNKGVALLIKTITPVLLSFVPNLKAAFSQKKSIEDSPESTLKSNIYGSLRRGVASLRSQIHTSEKASHTDAESTTN